MAQEDNPEDESELMMQEIELKTESFISLITMIKQKAFNFDSFKRLDKTTQVTQLPETFWEPIELGQIETVSSHQHELVKHPDGHHTNWNCDRINGSHACRNNNRKGVQGWRCNDCDFDLCIMCMKINRYFDQQSKVEKKGDDNLLETLDLMLQKHDVISPKDKFGEQ